MANINIADGTKTNAAVVHPLVRVGGTLNSADYDATATAIALFLDEGFFLAAYSDAPCFGYAACTTVKSPNLVDTASASTDFKHELHYPAMRRLVITAALSAGAEFNFYVPVLSKHTSINYLLIGLLAADATSANFNALKVFVHSGFAQGTTVKKLY